MKTKLLALIAFILAGCQTAEILTPVLLPVAVCRLIDGSAERANYVKAVSLAVSTFASGGNLTAAELQAKLSTIVIDGVKPYEAQAMWAVVVTTWVVVTEKYAQDPDKVTKLQRALLSITAGLDSALAQCGPQLPMRSVAGTAGYKVTKADVQTLADAIAAELK